MTPEEIEAKINELLTAIQRAEKLLSGVVQAQFLTSAGFPVDQGNLLALAQRSLNDANRIAGELIGVG